MTIRIELTWPDNSPKMVSGWPNIDPGINVNVSKAKKPEKLP